MHTLTDCSSKNALLRIIKFDFRPLSLIACGCRCDCGSICSRCCRRRRCRFRCRCCFRSATLTFLENLVKCLNYILIVICSFIAGLLNAGEVLLKCVKSLKQHIDKVPLDLHRTVSDFHENILHIVRQILHALISHGSSHTLKGMSGTEYLVDTVRILRLLLKNHKLI